MDIKKHEAKISKPKDNDKYIRGTFEVVDGELSFTCSTNNVSFSEVKQGLTKLRDEMNRQLDNQKECPFHTED